jgi:prepilin-type N-terminal cleavage/methylation domain-containing protein
MRQLRGFTLVEILLVSTLIAGISLAVFQCLSNGLKLWDRSRVLIAEEDEAFFFDRFASDLRNSFSFSALPFSGSEHSVTFPTIVMTRADRAGSRAAEGYADGLGRVGYIFNAASGVLHRTQANYSQALRNVHGDSKAVLKGVKNIRFKYFAAGSQEYRLSQEAGDPFPAGVEVDITLMCGVEEKTLRRFVAIPAGF